MAINRRRAPSSLISSQKKLGGHKTEVVYALLINGTVIHGTQKGDVQDRINNLHSVKSGKKWQIFLYGYNRISNCLHLNMLLPCLDAFPAEYSTYLVDRETCIAFKEDYISQHGRNAAANLTNDAISKIIGNNCYIQAKNKLMAATLNVKTKLEEKEILRAFLDEAIFNNGEVTYLAILDTTFKKDNIFKVFHRLDVLEILSNKLVPAVSVAGKVADDYNVNGQKTLLKYIKPNGSLKNIIEIEIRNDSNSHYRQVRFNMYSKDALGLLINDSLTAEVKNYGDQTILYGKSIEAFIYQS